jgi:hypothetical protein
MMRSPRSRPVPSRSKVKPSKAQTSRRAFAESFYRPSLEKLEDRTLLDAISVAEKTAILNGLQEMANWGARLGNFDLLAQPVPVIRQAVGPALQINDIFQSRLFQPVNQYLSGAMPTVEGLVSALQALPETGGHVTGTRDSGADELRFELTFDAVRTLSSVPIDLGGQATALGISVPTPPSVSVNASLHLNFSFDVGLTAHDFYLRLNGMDPAHFDTTVAANNLNFAVSFSTPPANLQVVNGTVSVAARATAQFNDPNHNGKITVADLQNPDIGRLIALGASGAGVVGMLPLNNPLPGYEVLGAGTIVARAGNPFSSTPDVSLSVGLSAQELQNQILNILTPLDAAGDRVLSFPAFTATLPILGKSLDQLFLQGSDPQTTTIGDFLKYRTVAASYLMGANPTADGLDQAVLTQALTVVGNVPGSSAMGTLARGPIGLAGGLDPVHNQVRFDVTFNSHLVRSLPIKLGDDVLRVYGISAAPSATVSVDTTMNLAFSFGMDLTNFLTSGHFTLDDVYLQINNFTAAGIVMASGMNFSLTVGFLQAQVAGGSIQLNPAGTVTIQKPDGNRRITLHDLNGVPIANFMSLATTGMLNASLPVTATFGGYNFGQDNPQILMSSSNVFAGAPTVTLPNFNLHLQNFANIRAQDVLGTFDELGSWLSQLTQIEGMMPIVDQGVSTGGNANNTLNDATRAWVPNNYAGNKIYITGGTGAGQVRGISANTATQLTVVPNWTMVPDAGSRYVIVRAVWGGISTGSNATNTLNDSSQTWTANQLANQSIQITSGTGAGQFRIITSNTPTQFTVGQLWTVVPDNTSNYVITGGPAPLQAPLPFAPDRTPADFLQGDYPDLGQAFAQRLTNQLRTGGSNPDPTFTTAQGLVDELHAKLGLDPAFINAHYDSTNQELTYHVRWTFPATGSTHGQAPVAFRMDLGSIGGATASANVNVDTTVTFEFTFGFNLLPDPNRLPTIASRVMYTPPNMGRLTSDAHFTVTLDRNDPVPVTVHRADTANDMTLADLVQVINSTLQGTSLGTEVVAELNPPTSGHIRLRTRDLGVARYLRIGVASMSDAAYTQLGFDDGSTGRLVSGDLFLQGASLTVGANLSSPADFATMAQVGFLGIQALHSNVSGNGNLTVDLKNPDTGEVGGRARLDDLPNYLMPDQLARLVATSLNGSATANLTSVSVVGDFLGTLPGNPAVRITVPDFSRPLSAMVAFTDFDPILRFRQTSLSQVVTGLTQAADVFATYSSFGYLNQSLPLLNRSAVQFLDYIGRFRTVISALQDTPPDSVQTLADVLRDALNLAGDSDLVQVGFAGTDLRIDLTYATAVTDAVGFNLDVASLARLASGGVPAQLQGVDRLANVSAAGGLQVGADATFHLSLGMDLSDPANPRLFLYDATGANLNFSVTGTNVTFTTTVGPVGLFVRGGTALVGRDSNGGSAAFIASVHHIQPTSDRHYFDDTMHPILGDVDVGLMGAVGVSLPLYYPTEAIPLGTPNILTITAANVADVLRQVAGSVAVVSPDIARLIGDPGTVLDLLRNPSLVVNGLDTTLGTLQTTLSNQVLNVNLPFVGRHLQDGTQFIQDFRPTLVQQVSTGMANAGDQIVDRVRQALFDVFCTRLHILVKPDGTPCTGIEDIAVTQDAEHVQFDMRLHQNLVSRDVPINFDIALDGLGLKSDPGSFIHLEVGWDFRFGFGVSRTDGFYLNTAVRDPLRVDAAITTPNDASMKFATGTLGLMAVEIADGDSQGHTSSFQPSFSVDISPRGGGDRLTLGQILAGNAVLQAHLEGIASLNTGLTVKFGSSDQFPTIYVDLNMRWVFQRSDPDLTGSPPELSLNNLRIKLGSVFTNFVGPNLQRFNDQIHPLQPVLDWIVNNIDLINFLFGVGSILGIAQGHGHADGVAFYANALGELDYLAHHVPNDPRNNNLIIDFGSYRLGSPEVDLRHIHSVDDINPRQTRAPQPLLTQLQTQNAPQPTIDFVTRLIHDGPTFGIDFPFVTDLGGNQPLRLFLHQNVDLVRINLPTLDIGFDFRIFIPILGPVAVTLSARMGAGFRFAGGFDTQGFQEFLADHNPADLLDGAYVDTRVSRAFISGGFGAGVGLDLGIIGGGVEGGLFANVDVRFYDPFNTGKLRYGVVSQFDDPICAVVRTGSLRARLYAWYSGLFGAIGGEVTIGQTGPLLSFDDHCNRDPVLATNIGGGVLRLNMGPYAGARVNLSTTDRNESFQVQHVSGIAGDETVSVTALGVTQQYPHVRRIFADGGHGNHVIDLRGVLADAEVHGGTGNATIYGSDGIDVIDTGTGSDVVVTGRSTSTVTAESGYKRITGGSGTTTVVVTANANFTLGDTLLSAPGYGTYVLTNVQNAVLTSGPGANTFTVSGWSGMATLVGRGGIDTVVSTNNANFTLSDSQLVRSTGGTFNLVGISRAVLTAGPSDDVFTFRNWTGFATLDGGTGSATIEVAQGSLSTNQVRYSHVATLKVSGGTLDVANDTTTPYLIVNVGTLTGTRDVTVTGTMTWTGGTMSGAGRTRSNGTLTISGPDPKMLDGRLFENAGMATWAGSGAIVFGSSATLTNLVGATFDDQTDGSLTGTGQVVNAGTFRKSAGTGATAIQVAFTNSNTGTVDGQMGTIRFSAGGSSSGVFSLASAAVVEFAGGTFSLTNSSSVGGSGTVVFSGGTVNVAGAYDVPVTTVNGGTVNFNSVSTSQQVMLSSGTLGGSATFTVPGSFAWTGGTMNGSGTTAVPHVATLTISGTAPKLLDQRTVIDSGAITWLSGDVAFANAGTVNITSIGSFDAQPSNRLSGTGMILNAGMFQKSGGPTTATVQIDFTNTGTVQVQTGTLYLSGTLTNFMNATLTNGTWLLEGTLQFVNPGMWTNATTLTLDGPTSRILDEAGRDALVRLTANAATGQFTLLNGRNLTINIVFTNAGTVNVQPGMQIGMLTLAGGGSSTGFFSISAGGMITIPSLTYTLGDGASEDGDGTLQVNGGTLRIAGSAVTARNFVLSNTGTLNGPGNLTLLGSSAWDGGTMSEAGTTTIAAGASLALGRTNANTTLDARTLVNAGTITLAGTHNVVARNNAMIANQAIALFDIESDNSLVAGGSQATFVNSGIVQKSAGTSTSTISVAFINAGPSGMVAAQRGTLSLAGGGNSSSVFAVDGGATLTIPSGSTYVLQAGASETGAGTLQVSGGTLTVAADVAVQNLVVSSGTLNGATTLTLMGACTWSGGTMGGTGTTTVASGASLALPGTSATSLDTRQLINSGTITLAGASNLVARNGATVTNQAGAVFDIQSNNSLVLFAGSQASFNNAGTLRKSNGSGLSTIGVTLSNMGPTGIVSVQTGTLNLAGGGNSTGNFAVDGGAILGMPSGSTFTLQPGASETGAGTLQVSGGTLTAADDVSVQNLTLSSGTVNGAGNLTLTGTSTWSGGTMADAGTTTVANGALLAISGASTTNLDARNLVNLGTTSLAGSSNVFVRDGAMITNQLMALFDIQTDNSLVLPNGSQASFINWGTLQKSGRTGTSLISVDFTNNSLIAVQSGTLRLSGGFSNFDGATLMGGSYDVVGTFQFPNAAVTTNAATIIIDGPAGHITDLFGNDALANSLASNASGASLTLQNGATVTTASGDLNNAGNVTIGSGSSLVISNGNYNQTAGGTVLNGGTVTAMSVNIGNGTVLSGPGAIAGDLINSGQVNPGGGGATTGTLTVSGAFMQTGMGFLTFQIGGTDPTLVDHLFVSGAATLDGTINAALINGYNPQAGDMVQIMTFASVTGDFAVQNISGFAEVFDTVDIPNSLSLVWSSPQAAEGGAGPGLRAGESEVAQAASAEKKASAPAADPVSNVATIARVADLVFAESYPPDRQGLIGQADDGTI